MVGGRWRGWVEMVEHNGSGWPVRKYIYRWAEVSLASHMKLLFQEKSHLMPF